MDKLKIKKLEEKGFKVGTVADFLELSPEESEMIELRLALSKTVKAKREAAKLTQEAFARKINSSQSRVAKIEAGDPSVSLDLIFKSLFSLGINRSELSKAIAGR